MTAKEKLKKNDDIHQKVGQKDKDIEKKLFCIKLFYIKRKKNLFI